MTRKEMRTWAGAAMIGACCMLPSLGCPPGSPVVPGPVIDVATCILDVVSKDLLAGQALDVALADAAVKCIGAATADNVTKARTLWAAHEAATNREKDAGK